MRRRSVTPPPQRWRPLCARKQRLSSCLLSWQKWRQRYAHTNTPTRECADTPHAYTFPRTQKERHTAATALESSARTQAEADQLSAKLAEMEAEMRALLEAVERQKLASVNKMRQLASFLTDMG